MNTDGSLHGKTVLITGSTDGLGKLVASRLFRRGADVLLHGRNEEKGRRVLEELKATGDGRLAYHNGDFSSLGDVKRFAERLLEEEPRIDVLINNAAAGSGKGSGNRRELSGDGFELRFAVNYLAQVLLTEKLLSALPAGSARIINVASAGQAPLDFSDPMSEKNYDGFVAYCRSKTALIMYTIDLAQRLGVRGIRVNAIHPASLMNTKMVLEDWGYARSTVEQGAEAVEKLIPAESTGEYYDGARRAKAISQAYETKARAALREFTAKLLEGYL